MNLFIKSRRASSNNLCSRDYTFKWPKNCSDINSRLLICTSLRSRYQVLNWNSDGKMVCNSKCFTLICLEGNLLRQHDIPRHKMTCGHEAPTLPRSTETINLLNVGRRSVVDAISRSAIRTRHVKEPVSMELRSLCG